MTPPDSPIPERVVYVPSPSPPPRRARWWMVALAVAWAVVLAAGIVWSARRGPPTAREQTTIAQAVPVVDRASAQIAAAALADGLAVVAVSGLERTGTCAVTVVRSGGRYQRVVTAAVAPGTELALLRRVADRLPAAYKVAVTTATGPKLKGDAGLFVALTGTVPEPGRVRFVADTGDCRPEAEPPATGSEPAGPDPAATEVLGRLRVSAVTWTRHRIACPGGGTLSTVEGVGADNDLPDAIDAALGTVDGRIAATADLYAFRSGQTGVMVRIEGSRLVASATTGC